MRRPALPGLVAGLLVSVLAGPFAPGVGAANAAGSGTVTVCVDRRYDGEPGSGLERPQPPGTSSWVALVASGRASLTGEERGALIDSVLDDQGSFDVTQAVDGTVHEVRGDTCAEVGVPTDGLYYPVQLLHTPNGTWVPTNGSGGNYNEGWWVGGGFPAGSAWSDDGSYLTPQGAVATFTGGRGGYGTYLPAAPTASAPAVRLTLVDKHFEAEVVKLCDTSTAGCRRSERAFWSSSHRPEDLSTTVGMYAWRTGATGSYHFDDLPAGSSTTVWEYLSPAEYAAGMRLTRLEVANPETGETAVFQGSEVQDVTLTQAVLGAMNGSAAASPQSLAVMGTFEVGGHLMGAGVVHQAHPGVTTVTAVNLDPGATGRPTASPLPTATAGPTDVPTASQPVAEVTGTQAPATTASPTPTAPPTPAEPTSELGAADRATPTESAADSRVWSTDHPPASPEVTLVVASESLAATGSSGVELVAGAAAMLLAAGCLGMRMRRRRARGPKGA